MKKFMLMAAMLAMLALLAVPALAQLEQEFEQESESGDVSNSFSASNSGDNSNLCPAALQFSNTGNDQNAQGFVQYNTETDDIELTGNTWTVEPSLEVTCEQSIEQAAAASS